MHTYTYTYIYIYHINIQTYIPTYIRTYIYIHIHTNIHIHTQSREPHMWPPATRCGPLLWPFSGQRVRSNEEARSWWAGCWVFGVVYVIWCLACIYIYISLSLSIYLSIYLSMYIDIYVHIHGAEICAPWFSGHHIHILTLIIFRYDYHKYRWKPIINIWVTSYDGGEILSEHMWNDYWITSRLSSAFDLKGLMIGGRHGWSCRRPVRLGYRIGKGWCDSWASQRGTCQAVWQREGRWKRQVLFSRCHQPSSWVPMHPDGCYSFDAPAPSGRATGWTGEALQTLWPTHWWIYHLWWFLGNQKAVLLLEDEGPQKESEHSHLPVLRFIGYKWWAGFMWLITLYSLGHGCLLHQCNLHCIKHIVDIDLQLPIYTSGQTII